MIRIKLIGFAVSLLTLVTFSSCFDEPEDPDDQFRDETRAIDAYINENGLNAMEDRTTELRYVINNPGDSIAPYTFDSVLVSYTLKLLSTDEVVLTETNRKIKLDDQIPGWQFLLPYLKRGGDMLMFIPSQYGFGDVKITGINGGAEIPRNSTLLYEVELHEVYHLNEVEQRRYEQKRIDAFLENANDTTAMLDPLSRIKYITEVEGSGSRPESNDSVNISYDVYVMHDKSLTLERFFSQSRADRSSFETFLNIEAWSVMLPLMKEGASMRFFMPSQYCFATQRVYNVAELDAGSIPSNAVLVFDIRLHTVGE